MLLYVMMTHGTMERKSGAGNDGGGGSRSRLACVRLATAKKKSAEALLFRVGGPGRGRTADTGIFSAVLYQLSYRAKHSVGRLS